MDKKIRIVIANFLFRPYYYISFINTDASISVQAILLYGVLTVCYGRFIKVIAKCRGV